MEFRSCPACKASVLEDDAEDCPFCGASMSGKSRPAAAKPAAGKTPPASGTKSSPSVPASKDPAKPAARPGAKPAPPTKAPAEAGSDDPFEVDTSAMRRAIKLSPRPTKTRTLEVSCPMCETPGYLVPTDAGKDVHCCNPNCLVPVFKTQKPKAAEAPAAEKKDNRLMLLLAGVPTLAIAGALVWIFVLAPKPEVVMQQDDGPTNDVAMEDLNLVPDNKVVRQKEAAPATTEEIRTQSLTAIVERARQRDRNRSAEYGTQLAAEAFADAGEIGKAREQVRRLQNTAAQAPYLQVQPLVQIGWQQLAAGNLKDAQQTATAALAKAKNAPKSIRKTLDASTALAALCVAVDNAGEAQELILRDRDHTARGTLSVLWRTSLDARTFQIDTEARRPWHIVMPDPMRIAVVESLVSYGYFDQAWAFCATGEDAAAQSACRAAWAGRLTQMAPAQAVERVTAAIAAVKANPATECQTWSAVASMAKSINNADLSKAALEKAVAAAANIKAATTAKVPGIKEIHDSEGRAFAGLPNPAPAFSAALAFLGLGTAQLEAGEKEAAWASVQNALAHFRSMAPSPIVTQELLDACDKQEGALRGELNQALSLGNNDQKLRTAFTRYRRQCGKLNAEAQRRMGLQVTALRFFTLEGLPSEVWQQVVDQSQNSDVNQRDPLTDTSLPGLILSVAEATSQADLVESVKRSSGDKGASVDPLDRVFVQAGAAVSQKKFSEASDIVERAYRDKLGKRETDRVDEIALRICARAQAATTPAAMIPFIKNLYDVVLQEDAYLQLAGYTMQAGTSAELWKVAVTARDLEALDHVSIYRGYLAGIPVKKPAAVSPSN